MPPSTGTCAPVVFANTGPTIAHTIDEAAQDKDEKIEIWRTEPERDKFRNYVMVMHSADLSPHSLAADIDSHHDPSVDNYIGCALWDVRIEPQAGGLDRQIKRDKRAAEVLRMRGEKSLVGHWETIGHPELGPGDYVDVNSIANVNVPDGTVFRIMEDTAYMNPDRLIFRRAFRLEIVSEYTPPE